MTLREEIEAAGIVLPVRVAGRVARALRRQNGVPDPDAWHAYSGCKALIHVARNCIRRASLYSIIPTFSQPDDWHSSLDNLTRNIGKRQRSAGLPAVIITVIAERVHVIALLPRESRPVTCGGLGIHAEPLSNNQIVGIVLKEAEAQGARTRLSPELADFAYRHGYIDDKKQKYGKRATERKPYTRRIARALNAAGEASDG